MAKLTSAQVQRQNLQDAFAPKMQAEAAIVSAAVPQEVGIGIELIAILIPLLLQMPCFASTDKAPAEFLESKYADGEYSFGVIRRARPETREAARQSGKGHLRPRELDMITIAAFDRARLNPEISAVFAAEFYAAHNQQ